ncbi:MAG: hypothetical protein ABEJ88_04705, partial [Halobacterium sp.]
QQSYADLVTAPLTKRFAQFSGATGGAVGVGLGVMFLLLKYIGKPVVTSSSEGGSTSSQIPQASIEATRFVNSSVQLSIYVLPLLAAAFAGVLGLYAARELDANDREVYVAGAAGALVGAVVLVVVGAFLASMAFGSVSANGNTFVEKPGSVAFANLVMNAVAIGVGAAVLGAGSAWADRTQF